MTEFVYWVIEAILLMSALRSRRWAMMILAFSLPFSRRMPAFPVPLLNYQNLVFLFALIAYATHPKEKGTSGGRVHYVVPLAILSLLITASFINTITTFVPKVFWRLWDPYENVMNYRALMTCFAFYVLTSIAVRTRDDLRAVFHAGVAGILVEASYSALEYVVLHPGRVTGHLEEPNSLGSYLAPSFGLLFALALVLPRSHRLWMPAFAGSGACIVGLLGTLSRGSFIAAGFGFIFLSSLLNRRVLAAGIAFLALNALWLPTGVQRRLQETFVPAENEGWRFGDGKGDRASPLLAEINQELEQEAAAGEISESQTRLDPSVQSRIVVWTVAGQIVRDYPLGVGFGVFPWYMQYYSDVVRFKATHNIYLKVITESGIPAFALFFFLVVSFLKQTFKIGRTGDDPELRALGYGMFGYLVILMLNALSIDTFFQIDINGQFWMFMGAVLQIPRLAATPAPAVIEAPRPSAPRERPLYELVR